ncbi:5-methylcytosine restriction system specificity protein McrC [Stieleria marina]|uniref:5-methylcytosine restriction system specificity protein McrC n=1 Tax=Stieleria marina TaxID=1930275 RepID=UPI003AF393B5
MYPCLEHGEVVVPIENLIVDGKIDVFPEITGRGYFDIDYRGGELRLIAKSYIGVIPINSRVAIHVRPRFPIENALYLVQKAKKSLGALPSHLRKYAAEPLKAGSAEDLFGRAVIEALSVVQRDGLLRQYVTKETTHGFRGRIQFGKSVSRFIAKGYRYRHVRDVSFLTSDLPENRLVKHTLEHLVRYLQQLTGKDSISLATHASRLVELFDTVSPLAENAEKASRQVAGQIVKLPGSHRAYERLLWLCYLIATQQGVSLESFGKVQIESLVIRLDDVFEAYVRELIQEQISGILPGGQVFDGNVHRVPLYVHGGDNQVKPDIYIRKPGVRPIVLDAKYKPKLKAADRYEVLAFCEALQSKLAIFISPSNRSESGSRFLGVTAGGVELHELKIDLGRRDIESAESEFVNNIRMTVEARLATLPT